MAGCGRGWFRRFVLNTHMPVLLTAFFWVSILWLPERQSFRALRVYLFFAWPLAVMVWLIAAAWMRRELMRSGFYLVYFWVFLILVVVLALGVMPLPEGVWEMVGRHAWLLLVYLVVVRRWLVQGVLSFRRVASGLWVLLACVAVIEVGSGRFVRTGLFAAAVAHWSGGNTITQFETPANLVAFAADLSAEGDMAVRVYSCGAPRRQVWSADVRLEWMDAAGERAVMAELLKSYRKLDWVLVEEYRVREGCAWPVRVVYRERQGRSGGAAANEGDFVRVVMVAGG